VRKVASERITCAVETLAGQLDETRDPAIGAHGVGLAMSDGRAATPSAQLPGFTTAAARHLRHADRHHAHQPPIAGLSASMKMSARVATAVRNAAVSDGSG
jgi:hypothetical protein